MTMNEMETKMINEENLKCSSFSEKSKKCSSFSEKSKKCSSFSEKSNFFFMIIEEKGKFLWNMACIIQKVPEILLRY